MKDSQFNKLFVFTCSLVPAVLLSVDFLSYRIRDTQTLLRTTGICTLIFLALSLAVTPLHRITGKNHWSLYRRMLGLYAFFYCSLHVLIFIFLREGNNWPQIWQDAIAGLNINFDALHLEFAKGTPLGTLVYDLLQKNYILFGIIAFLIMVPLAATSTTWSIKKMGNKNWKLLHKLVYLSALAASTHYLLTGKTARETLKLTFASLFAALLLFRLIAWARDTWFPPAKPTKPTRPTMAPSRPAP